MANHSITGYQFSILLEKSERASIWGNTIVGTTKWQTGELKNVIGVLLVNGKNARMENNDISSGVFGVFASDRGGRLEQNELHSNFIGLILCKVPAQIPLRPGEILSSQISAREWKVRFNSAFGNFNDGYLVIDGANRNILENNDASNNGAYDIELAGESERFGFTTPESFRNTVVVGLFDDIVVKDCGDKNLVRGGQLVDNATDPCF